MTRTPGVQRTSARSSLHDLLADPVACAEAAGLRYVERNGVGILRRRCGRGFRYVGPAGRAVPTETRARIAALAIPPAWREVWICEDEDGHLLATGVDDRGRTQYLYHQRWREFRDLVNFYRLTEVGRALGAVRRYVDGQLRRRTLDRDRVVAAMLRLADGAAIRVGNEIYAEENDTIGLCTLEKRHVRVVGPTIYLAFPAKSGKRAELSLTDAAVTRVVVALLQRPGRRLFTLDRKPVTAEEVNERLAALTGGVMTAKDFRTWRGTSVAFSSLRRASEVSEQRALDAIDAAAAVLGNTRAVARGHYVHPHVVETFLDGTMPERLARAPRLRVPGLTEDERALLGYLDGLLADYSPQITPVGAPTRAAS
jgi:DNA topoisomerase-1